MAVNKTATKRKPSVSPASVKKARSAATKTKKDSSRQVKTKKVSARKPKATKSDSALTKQISNVLSKTNAGIESGMKYVSKLDSTLRQLEKKILPKDFVKVLSKIEKMLENFNAKIVRKIK